MTERAAFQEMTVRPDLETLARAVADAKRGRASGQLSMTAAMAWAAFACPDATAAVYDTLASAWLGEGEASPLPEKLSEAPLEASFWEAFWAVVDGAEQGYDATSITVAVASLGAAVHPDMADIAENSARNHPGATAALTRPVPGRTDLDHLASCAPGSLGHTLYRMIVDNGYDLEVLDREAIKLAELPPSLSYLNTRILQMHDVWHLVAGYQTSGSHEIAISSFQLAQFGHNYSAMFLATVAMISHGSQPRSFHVLMQIIMEAWQHGRASPPLMDVEWEDEWAATIAEIRARYGIPVYQSVFPADLMEKATEGSLWQKLGLGVRIVLYNRRLKKQAYPEAA